MSWTSFDEKRSKSPLNLSLIQVQMVLIIECCTWLYWHHSSLSFLNKVLSQLLGKGTSADVHATNWLRPLENPPALGWGPCRAFEDSSPPDLMGHKALGLGLQRTVTIYFCTSLCSGSCINHELLACFYPAIVHSWTCAGYYNSASISQHSLLKSLTVHCSYLFSFHLIFVQ